MVNNFDIFRGKLSRSRHRRRVIRTTRVYRVSNASIPEHTRSGKQAAGVDRPRLLLVTIISLPMALAGALGEAVVLASSSA
jgi:hypothetical protein